MSSISNILLFRDLPDTLTCYDLSTITKDFSRIRFARIMAGTLRSGEKRFYGIVLASKLEEATCIKENLDSTMFHDKKLHINYCSENFVRLLGLQELECRASIPTLGQGVAPTTQDTVAQSVTSESSSSEQLPASTANSDSAKTDNLIKPSILGKRVRSRSRKQILPSSKKPKIIDAESPIRFQWPSNVFAKKTDAAEIIMNGSGHKPEAVVSTANIVCRNKTPSVEPSQQDAIESSISDDTSSATVSASKSRSESVNPQVGNFLESNGTSIKMDCSVRILKDSCIRRKSAENQSRDSQEGSSASVSTKCSLLANNNDHSTVKSLAENSECRKTACASKDASTKNSENSDVCCYSVSNSSSGALVDLGGKRYTSNDMRSDRNVRADDITSSVDANPSVDMDVNNDATSELVLASKPNSASPMVHAKDACAVQNTTPEVSQTNKLPSSEINLIDAPADTETVVTTCSNTRSKSRKKQTPCRRKPTNELQENEPIIVPMNSMAAPDIVHSSADVTKVTDTPASGVESVSKKWSPKVDMKLSSQHPSDIINHSRSLEMRISELEKEKAVLLAGNNEKDRKLRDVERKNLEIMIKNERHLCNIDELRANVKRLEESLKNKEDLNKNQLENSQCPIDISTLEELTSIAESLTTKLKEAEDKLLERTEERDDLLTQVGRLEREKIDLENAKVLLLAEKKELINKVDRLTTQVSDSGKVIAHLTNQKNQLLAEEASLRQLVNQLETINASAVNEFQNFESRIKSLEEDNSDLKTELCVLRPIEVKFNKIRSDYEVVLAQKAEFQKSYESSVMSVSEESAKIKMQLELSEKHSKAQIVKLDESIKKLYQDKKKLESELASIRRKEAAATTELQDMSSQLQNFKKNNSSLERDNGNLKEKVKLLETELKDSIVKLDFGRKSNTSLLEQYQSENKRLTMELNTAKASHTGCATEASRLNEEITNLKKSNDLSLAKVAELQAQLSNPANQSREGTTCMPMGITFTKPESVSRGDQTNACLVEATLKADFMRRMIGESLLDFINVLKQHTNTEIGHQ